MLEALGWLRMGRLGPGWECLGLAHLFWAGSVRLPQARSFAGCASIVDYLLVHLCFGCCISLYCTLVSLPLKAMLSMVSPPQSAIEKRIGLCMCASVKMCTCPRGCAARVRVCVCVCVSTSMCLFGFVRVRLYASLCLRLCMFA